MKHLSLIIFLLIAGMAGVSAQEQNPQVGELSDTAYNSWTTNAPLPAEDAALDMTNKWVAETIDTTITPIVEYSRFYDSWPKSKDNVLSLITEWDENEGGKDRGYFYKELDSAITVNGELKISGYFKLLSENYYDLGTIQLGIELDGIIYRANSDPAAQIAAADSNKWFLFHFKDFGSNGHDMPPIGSIDHLYIMIGSAYYYHEYEAAYLYITETGQLLCSTGNNSPIGLEAKPGSVPENFTLKQNYPNPFNPTTNIVFSLPKSSKVKLEIYDSIGRFVAEVINEHMISGKHSVRFNASNLSSGVYYYKIKAGDYTQTRKMLVLR